MSYKVEHPDYMYDKKIDILNYIEKLENPIFELLSIIVGKSELERTREMFNHIINSIQL